MWKIVLVLSTVFSVGACVNLHPPIEHPPQDFYIVQPGDNIYSIAFALEMSPKRLQGANPWLNADYITPGMRITLPHYIRHDDTATGRKIYDDDRTYDNDQAVIPIQRSGFIWPLDRVQVSSHYGYRRGHLHAGIDLTAPRGTSIQASARGRVIFSGYQRRYGHIIVIDHGGGIETAYAHNSRNLVVKGQRVKQGQLIARVGRSGNATGYHVHFEFRRYGKAVNPIPHVQAAL